MDLADRPAACPRTSSTPPATTSAGRATTRRRAAPRRPTTPASRGCPTTALVYFVIGRTTTRSSRWCWRSRVWACGARSTASSRSTATATPCAGSPSTTRRKRPGLGGEIGNPKWQALWRGRKGFDANGQPKLAVIKGQAGPPEKDPHRVDGLSGATITSNAHHAADAVLAVGRRLRPLPEDASAKGRPHERHGRTVRQARSARRCSRRSSSNNPIAVQVLGICSALAVTTRMDKALVMGIGVTAGHRARQPGGQPGAQPHARAASASSCSCRSSPRW